MGKRVSFVVSVAFAFVAFSSVVAEPAKISLGGAACQAPARRAIVQKAADRACFCVNRALHVLTKHEERVREMFKKGSVFPVYFKNKPFYQRLLRSRQTACTSSSVPLSCVGRCNTPQQTMAYVRLRGNRAVPPIYLCDEFFGTSESNRADVMAHEYGRLENIADGPAWDHTNIALWDRILEVLCNDLNYQELTKPE